METRITLKEVLPLILPDEKKKKKPPFCKIQHDQDNSSIASQETDAAILYYLVPLEITY